MSDEKKGLPQLKGLTSRATRIVLYFWGCIIAIGGATTYFRPILPWVAGGVAVLMVIWTVIAVVRWQRSKW